MSWQTILKEDEYKKKLGNLLDNLLNMKISEEEYKKQKEELDSEFL